MCDKPVAILVCCRFEIEVAEHSFFTLYFSQTCASDSSFIYNRTPPPLLSSFLRDEEYTSHINITRFGCWIFPSLLCSNTQRGLSSFVSRYSSQRKIRSSTGIVLQICRQTYSSSPGFKQNRKESCLWKDTMVLLGPYKCVGFDAMVICFE